MAWTTPRTFATDDLIDETMMNQQVRDNLLYLLSGRPQTVKQAMAGGTYTTTSTSFVDVDATNVSVSLTISGSKVLIGVQAMTGGGSGVAYFDFTVDGARVSGCNEGLAAIPNDGHVSLNYLKTGLAAGSHTIRLQWMSPAGAGLRSIGTHHDIFLWAVEVG